MLKVATVFSGIGAPEQALKRMGVNFCSVLACDNGERIIDIDYDSEFEKIKKMNSANEKKEYVDQLYLNKTKKHNYVKDSYLSNYKVENNFFYEDVKLLDGTDFKGKVDLFIGGSPCQSFSIAGQRGGFNDTRGTLFHEFARLVDEIQPKVFIYENVYGVLTHDKGKTWETMQNVFNELNYSFKWEILDAKDYGIPQGRRRLFVVGFKNKNLCKKFNFPLKKELKFCMQDFLLDNCAEGHYVCNENGEITLIPGGEKVNKYLSDKLVKYVMSPGTKNFYHENSKIDLPIARAILSTQGNTHRASVNNYVTTNGKIRALEPRESLRLMGLSNENGKYQNVYLYIKRKYISFTD